MWKTDQNRIYKFLIRESLSEYNKTELFPNIRVLTTWTPLQMHSHIKEKNNYIRYMVRF